MEAGRRLARERAAVQRMEVQVVDLRRRLRQRKRAQTGGGVEAPVRTRSCVVCKKQVGMEEWVVHSTACVEQVLLFAVKQAKVQAGQGTR
eukprot:SAG11_NODE_45_length_20574_cov_8.004054_5_plen_90_part_00